MFVSVTSWGVWGHAAGQNSGKREEGKSRLLLYRNILIGPQPDSKTHAQPLPNQTSTKIASPSVTVTLGLSRGQLLSLNSHYPEWLSLDLTFHFSFNQVNGHPSHTSWLVNYSNATQNSSAVVFFALVGPSTMCGNYSSLSLLQLAILQWSNVIGC